MLFRLCIGIFLLIYCLWVNASPWIENFRDVPLDNSLPIQIFSNTHTAENTWSEDDRYEVLFLSQSLEPISLSELFSIAFWGSPQKKAALHEKLRRLNYYRFHDERWENYLIQAVHGKELSLNWQYHRVDLESLQEKLKSPSTAEHLVLFVHADSLGYIWAFDKRIAPNFFSDIAPQIKSLGIFSCYPNKLVDVYKLQDIEGISLFFPNEEGEITAWKSKSFLRLVELNIKIFR